MINILHALILFFIIFSNMALANNRIIIQSTTSTKSSGLYDYIIPIVKNEINITLDVVAAGTGAAINNAMNCDGDILLVHSKKREEIFVTQGYSKKRHDLMYNDFVIIGPKNDPSNLRNKSDVFSAFKTLFNKQILFVSRGDESGTHIKEKQIWKSIGLNSEKFSVNWYRETGSGMGSTLNVTIGIGGYTLSDRATWLKFNNKKNFKIHLEDNKNLLNQYGIMIIDKLKCPAVKYDSGMKFLKWILSNKGQEIINSYKVDGKQLFFGNAKN